MRRRLFGVILAGVMVGVLLHGGRWVQATALADTVKQALLEKGVPVVAVSADLTGRLSVTYRHGEKRHAGPMAPFFNDQIEAILRQSARGVEAYRLTILDSEDRVVLAVTQPLPQGEGALSVRRDPAGVRLAMDEAIQGTPGAEVAFHDRPGGLEAVIRLSLSAAEVQPALDAAVQKVSEAAEGQRENGLTRLALTVEGAEGQPVFTLLADYSSRILRAWTAPGIRNPLAGGPPAPQSR